MQVPKQKLTLSTPYHKINDALWQSKLVNSKKEKENLQLKTKIHIAAHHHPQSSSTEQTTNQLQLRFAKLSQKQKDQAAWIKETCSQIDERHYEQLIRQVRKIENKLDKLTHSTLKMQKALKRQYLKRKEEGETHCAEAYEEGPQNHLQKLEEQKRQLQKQLQRKMQRSNQIDSQNKELNKQIISLLTVKNALKNEVRKSNLQTQTQTEAKVWLARSKVAFTN